MYNYTKLEKWYQKCVDHLDEWMNEENCAVVNIDLLEELDLLEYPKESKSSKLHQTFHTIETPEKITLLNDEFVVWIVSEMEEQYSATYTFIAKNNEGVPKLDFVFISSGVYNCSHIVLQVLEKYLDEIEENEALIKKLAE